MKIAECCTATVSWNQFCRHHSKSTVARIQYINLSTSQFIHWSRILLEDEYVSWNVTHRWHQNVSILMSFALDQTSEFRNSHWNHWWLAECGSGSQQTVCWNLSLWHWTSYSNIIILSIWRCSDCKYLFVCEENKRNIRFWKNSIVWHVPNQHLYLQQSVPAPVLYLKGFSLKLLRIAHYHRPQKC